MLSPVGVGSVTTSRSRSLSMRSASARSISAAPAITTSEADNGRSTNRPRVSSSSSRVISSTKLNIAAAPLLYRRDGRRRIRVERENRIEAADREHLADVRHQPEQRDLAFGLLHLFRHDEEHPQPGAADVFEPAHVDRKARRAAAERRVEAVLRRSGAAAVEPAGKLDQRNLARLLLR